MKIKVYRNPPKTEAYLYSKKEVREFFESIENLRVVFGICDSFKFDSRCFHRPDVKGTVVADVTVNRELEPAIYLFSIEVNKISEKVRKEFVENITTDMKNWLKDQIAKNETEIIGHESLIIELRDDKFLEHKLRYL